MATVSPSIPAATELRVSLLLTPPVRAAYEAEALEYGVELEELLSSRLRDCVEHNATKPVYFNDQQRRELESLLGRNVDKPSSVLSILRRNVTATINGLSITLTPDVLDRLRTRAPKSADFKDWLQGKVTEWAQQFVGLR